MQAARLFRSSGCLLTSGFLVLAVSLGALALACVLVTVGPSSARKVAADREEQVMAKALTAFDQIHSLSPGVVAEFRRDGKVSEETLAQLPYEQRTRVGRVLADHAVSMLGEKTGDVGVAAVGTTVIVALCILGVPGTLVGLLLVRRRRVWRCSACGYAWDRT
jgi:hypothetical protein